MASEPEFLSYLVDIIEWEQIAPCVIIAPEMSTDYVVPLIQSRPEMVKSAVLVSPPFEFNLSAILKSEVKMLLMTGEFEHFEMKRYTSPNLEHLVIPLSANFYFVENSVQFNKLILDYLSKMISGTEDLAGDEKDKPNDL